MFLFASDPCTRTLGQCEFLFLSILFPRGDLHKNDPTPLHLTSSALNPPNVEYPDESHNGFSAWAGSSLPAFSVYLGSTFW